MVSDSVQISIGNGRGRSPFPRRAHSFPGARSELRGTGGVEQGEGVEEGVHLIPTRGVKSQVHCVEPVIFSPITIPRL